MRDKDVMARVLGLSVLYLALANPAFAHSSHVDSGFLHPLTGPDHVLAMIGAGMWAAFLAARKPAAALGVPLAFMVMMAFGAAAGFAGIKLPFSEAGVIASIFMLGGLVLAGVRVPTATAMLIVGWFAMLHGYSHALEAPAGNPGGYMLGFLAATTLLQGLGLGLGRVVQKLTGNLGLQALGGLVMAGGAVVLVAH
jgi:urease accessory protein